MSEPEQPIENPLKGVRPMKTIWMVMLALITLAQPLTGQGKVVAYPATAQMDKYPIITDTTGGVAKMTGLGLTSCRLKEPWTGLNWYQNYRGIEVARFVYETLSAGTPAYCDADGTPRYKGDCFNRLATETDCPGCITWEQKLADIQSAINSLAEGQNSIGLSLREQSGAIANLANVTGGLDRSVREESGRSGRSERPNWLSRNKEEIIVGAGAAILVGMGIKYLKDGCLVCVNVENTVYTITTPAMGGITLLRFGGGG